MIAAAPGQPPCANVGKSLVVVILPIIIQMYYVGVY